MGVASHRSFPGGIITANPSLQTHDPVQNPGCGGCCDCGGCGSAETEEVDLRGGRVFNGPRGRRWAPKTTYIVMNSRVVTFRNRG